MTWAPGDCLRATWGISAGDRVSREATGHARDIGDRRGEGNALGNLGLLQEPGETRRAIEYFEQHLTIAREIGDRRGEGNALWNSALALNSLGDRSAPYERKRRLKISEGDRRPKSREGAAGTGGVERTRQRREQAASDIAGTWKAPLHRRQRAIYASGDDYWNQHGTYLDYALNQYVGQQVKLAGWLHRLDSEQCHVRRPPRCEGAGSNRRRGSACRPLSKLLTRPS